VRAALDPELQAEVESGWENSAGQPHDQIAEFVEVFLEHDEAWRTGGEGSATVRQAAAMIGTGQSNVVLALLDAGAAVLHHREAWIPSDVAETTVRAVSGRFHAPPGHVLLSDLAAHVGLKQSQLRHRLRDEYANPARHHNRICVALATAARVEAAVAQAAA